MSVQLHALGKHPITQVKTYEGLVLQPRIGYPSMQWTNLIEKLNNGI